MELDFINWLRSRGTLPPGALDLLDDAALLGGSGTGDWEQSWVVTSDLICDGVHFRLEEHTWSEVGRKALAVNLSDLAAMAARPRAVLVSLLLPSTCQLSDVQAIYQGMEPLLKEYDVEILGGDTNRWEGRLALNVMALGQLTHCGPLRRSGAEVGDEILVTGSLGGSLLGKHLKFQPRVAEALYLHQQYALHAGMDISDGLALDAARMAQASRVGICLRPEQIPCSPAAQQSSQQTGRSALDHALSDGEDFELLLAVAPAAAQRILQDRSLVVPVSRVGYVVDQAGLWQQPAGQRPTRLPVTGWVH